MMAKFPSLLLLLFIHLTLVASSDDNGRSLGILVGLLPDDQNIFFLNCTNCRWADWQVVGEWSARQPKNVL